MKNLCTEKWGQKRLLVQKRVHHSHESGVLKSSIEVFDDGKDFVSNTYCNQWFVVARAVENGQKVLELVMSPWTQDGSLENAASIIISS